MKRRSFFKFSTGIGIALGLPVTSCNPKIKGYAPNRNSYEKLVSSLLTDWCEGLLSTQINKPEDHTLHGALYCQACDKIHGRCMDAVYPFMYLADKTGEQKYLQAAIDVMLWSENVSKEDGSWTVIPDPKSWSGITVFGAIALGEALHHHGHILPIELYNSWKTRLSKAALFIHKNFTIDYSHINYPFTAIYALNLLGRIFDNDDYLKHSRELAKEIPKWLTKPNKLIFGENSPSDQRSAKDLPSVDIGYNVEESLNGLVQYAVLENDNNLLQLITESMQGHLEFMLPDGAWDNSWGTRQNKWSYWGSRTTDGCQPAFVLMSKRDPAFGTAAILNTRLLERCTIDGLLAGGLHYRSHQVKPCVHHTFAHAKSLAFILDHSEYLNTITNEKQIPRTVAQGVKHFPEVDVWLAAKGPWRATISTYDAIFKKKYSQAATGGALSILWHDKVGPIITASMAEYILVEKNNQQEQPDGEDFSLTPRIECTRNNEKYSNLYDMAASVSYTENNKAVKLEVTTQLCNMDRIALPNSTYHLQYIFENDKTVLTVLRKKQSKNSLESDFILPIISASTEQVLQISTNRVEVSKGDFNLVIVTDTPLSIIKTKKDRVFNMVPGMEAIPIVLPFASNQEEINCSITIESI